MSARDRHPHRLGVCWKWIDVDGDPRRSGVSAADHAALEVALTLARTLAEHDGGAGEVTVVSLGPLAAERALREALAAGADRAVRIAASPAIASRAVGTALAAALGEVDWIVCGDHSADRGSGSVPAFVAAELGAAQALGLLEVAVDGRVTADGAPVLRALRRLDGGRREQLHVTSPAVLSVEGSVATLRRASLPAELAARHAAVEVVAGPTVADEIADAVRPFRPRPRVVPPPPGATALDRIRALTDAGAAVVHGETVTLDPPEAAARIVAALEEWGYLDASADESARQSDR